MQPASSSSNICSRACCPPDKEPNDWRAHCASSYRESAAIASLRARACSVIRISSGHRPARSGRVWVCANSPGTTLAPSRATPSCGTSAPPSSCRKNDFPEPLEPSTATRSPYQTSRSKGCISPVSSRFSQITARLPVRPPRSRMRMSWSLGASSGGPASSNRRSRVSAAWRREAMAEL